VILLKMTFSLTVINLDCMCHLHGCFLILKSRHHQCDCFFDGAPSSSFDTCFGIQTKTSLLEY
jgi:hypothetical protein